MASPRILFCGDVLGRYKQLFKRVSSVNKSTGPFDALLCVGQFFPDSPDGLAELSDLVEARLPLPIPTYFIGDYGVGAADVLLKAMKEPDNRGFKLDGLKIRDGLYWLKGSGKFKLRGLSIAYLSGKHSEDSQQNGTYTEDDIDALRALAEESEIIDIFLTNEWPSGILNRADISDAPSEISDPSGTDPIISELAAEIKPRYHIAGTKAVFFAREPYANKEAVHVSRFVGLAAVGNKDKQKFIHAISPTPASAMPASEIGARPPNTTLSPYLGSAKTAHAKEATKRPSNTDSDTQYWRYDVSNKRPRQGTSDGERLCFKFTSTGSCLHGGKCNFRHDVDARELYLKNGCFDYINKGKCERGSDCKFSHSIGEGDNDSHGKQMQRQRSKSCWFCLSSPEVESHLILSIGESYYCALAKGPLVDDHALIIPIEHCPTSILLGLDAELELGRYKNALKTYFKCQGKAVVFYEWMSKQISHANLQAIPIPLTKSADVVKIFNLAAKKMGFEFIIITSSSHDEGRKSVIAQFDGTSNLFYVDLPEGTILCHSVSDNEKFPGQFGREVLAGLLNMADRADWRNCKLNKEEETKMAEGFKKRFEEFDPAR